MKRVYKYGTGQDIPEGAKYLCTKTETKKSDIGHNQEIKENILVCHYFLVEVEE